jgi:hypothetical protein
MIGRRDLQLLRRLTGYTPIGVRIVAVGSGAGKTINRMRRNFSFQARTQRSLADPAQSSCDHARTVFARCEHPIRPRITQLQKRTASGCAGDVATTRTPKSEIDTA